MVVTAGTACQFGLAARVQPGANTAYFGRVNDSNDTYDLFKVVSGTSTSLASGTATGALTANRVIPLELSVVGSTITFKADGVQVYSVTDTAISAAGRAGFRHGSGNGIHADNFSAATGDSGAGTGTVTGQAITVTGATVRARDDVGAVLPDATFEWWVQPSAVAQSSLGRTVTGGMSPTGEIVVADINHATRVVTRRAISTTPVSDDHNAPAVWVMAGHRPVVVWTRHNADVNLRVKVGAVDDLDSLVAATETTIANSAAVSYTQIYRITSLSDGTQDTFWCFSRINTAGWSVREFSVNQSTGVVTSNWVRSLITGTFLYLATAEATNGSGEQVIRVATFWNPTTTNLTNHYFEINAATGAVTSPAEALTANLITPTGLPLDGTTLTPIMPDAPSGSRRWVWAVRPGPDAAQIAYAEFVQADGDNGTYYVYDVAGATTTSVGPSGPSFYTTANSNYLPGLAFPDPSNDGSLYRATGNGTTDTLDVLVPDGLGGYDATTLLSQPSANGRLARPVTPHGGGEFAVLVSDLTSYNAADYTDFEADTLAIAATSPEPDAGTGSRHRLPTRLGSGSLIWLGRRRSG